MKKATIKNRAPGVDLTPMLDIVFILIIFFVVTTSFIKEVGVAPIRNQSTLSLSQSHQRNLTFNLVAANYIEVGGHHIDIWRAEALISRRFAEQPDQPIVIKLNEGVPLRDFIRIFDVAQKVGLSSHQIAII